MRDRLETARSGGRGRSKPRRSGKGRRRRKGNLTEGRVGDYDGATLQHSGEGSQPIGAVVQASNAYEGASVTPGFSLEDQGRLRRREKAGRGFRIGAGVVMKLVRGDGQEQHRAEQKKSGAAAKIDCRIAVVRECHAHVPSCAIVRGPGHLRRGLLPSQIRSCRSHLRSTRFSASVRTWFSPSTAGTPSREGFYVILPVVMRPSMILAFASSPLRRTLAILALLLSVPSGFVCPCHSSAAESRPRFGSASAAEPDHCAHDVHGAGRSPNRTRSSQSQVCQHCQSMQARVPEIQASAQDSRSIRTTPDASHFGVFHAFEQALDFLRFTGDSSPPGFTRPLFRLICTLLL